MTPLALPLTSAPRLLLALVVMAVPLLSSGGTALGQGVDLSTEHVTVDLSVLGDVGAPMAAGASSMSPMVAQPRGPGGLLVPGPTNPTSRLHVAVPTGAGGERITLKPPSAAPKKTAAAPATKPAPAKRPAAEKPAERPIASAAPAPLTSPPPAPAMPAEPAAKGAPPTPPPASAQPEKKPAAATAATPAPAAPPAVKPQPVKTEQASAPPVAVVKEGRAMLVAFAAEDSKLPDASRNALTAVAKQLKDNEGLRLQLLAYAGGKDLSPSKARRLSLSRALSVRSFLIENGIRSTRIDVRALGDKTTDEPLNRVDVNIVER